MQSSLLSSALFPLLLSSPHLQWASYWLNFIMHLCEIFLWTLFILDKMCADSLNIPWIIYYLERYHSYETRWGAFGGLSAGQKCLYLSQSHLDNLKEYKKSKKSDILTVWGFFDDYSGKMSIWGWFEMTFYFSLYLTWKWAVFLLRLIIMSCLRNTFNLLIINYSLMIDCHVIIAKSWEFSTVQYSTNGHVDTLAQQVLF